MKKLYSLVLAVFSILSAAGAALSQTMGSANPSSGPSAIFLSITGDVTVQDAQGQTRKVTRGEITFEGESISVGKQSRTTLQFFDGSTLDLSSESQVVIKTLRKPSEKEKRLGFHLNFGMVLARVKKLTTASSSFEVDAGGVITGVRGTEFAFSYDPNKNKVTLDVHEGTVYVKTAGKTLLYHAGERMEFINGRPIPETTGGSGTGLRNQGRFQVTGGSMGNTGGTLGGWDSSLSLKGATGASLVDLNNQFTASVLLNHNNGLNSPLGSPGAPNGPHLILPPVNLPPLGILP